MPFDLIWTPRELQTALENVVTSCSFTDENYNQVANVESVLEGIRELMERQVKPHVLVSDDSGHDYLILREDREDFRQWVHQEECWEAYETEPGDGGLVRTATTDYNAARVEGRLEIYLFDC